MTRQEEEIAVLTEVLEAFTDETRGDPWPGVVQGTLRLMTVPSVFVTIFRDSEGWWEAELAMHDDRDQVVAGTGPVFFAVPLKQGPVWASEETSTQDVVDWLREITDSKADRD